MLSSLNLSAHRTMSPPTLSIQTTPRSRLWFLERKRIMITAGLKTTISKTMDFKCQACRKLALLCQMIVLPWASKRVRCPSRAAHQRTTHSHPLCRLGMKMQLPVRRWTFTLQPLTQNKTREWESWKIPLRMRVHSHKTPLVASNSLKTKRKSWRVRSKSMMKRITRNKRSKNKRKSSNRRRKKRKSKRLKRTN